MERSGTTTPLEWARDSDFRFFPAVADELFGYRLHIADIATNKALAAGGRREPRDVLDLLYIHGRHLPLGAVIWAAVGKDPGYSPESLICEIRRNARYAPMTMSISRSPNRWMLGTWRGDCARRSMKLRRLLARC